MGKPLGVDILEQKITIPLLGALANVSQEEQDRVRQMVGNIVEQPELRDDIVRFAKDNGGLEYAVEQLDKYVAQAVGALAVLPQCKEREILEEMAYFTAKRVM